jgi:hypothetical protein
MRTRKARRRGRRPFRATAAVPAPPRVVPPYPRGNPLTDSVTLTDAAGASWLVYVEPAPAAAPLRRNAAVLPGRRLRFDSLERSLILSPVPAGAPFLPDGRLLQLLSLGRPVPPPAPQSPPAAIPVRALRSLDLAGSAAAAVGVLHDAASRHWQATAGVRRLCTRTLIQAVAPAVLLMVVVWDALLVRSRARI